MKLLTKALLEAQKEMGDAKKDAKNPFFKSSYADLNSIREACIPVLNNHDIVVMQPMINIEGKNYIKTLLMHTSGEMLESFTEIIYSKQNDAQSQGSGITYARRYGLQSLVNVGAVDDDGHSASVPQPKVKPAFTEANFEAAHKAGATIEQIKSKYTLTSEMETKFNNYGN